MNRNDYIKRVLPFLGGFSNEQNDEIMGKIAQYLVDAGEENEEQALDALGMPEALGMKIASEGGSFEIKPYVKKSVSEPATAEQKATVDAKKDFSTYLPESVPRKQKNKKRMAVILGILVITSPLWIAVTVLFLVLGLVLALIVAALLLLMTVGGATATVIGVTKLFSVAPVGLMLTGAGLLLLGIAGLAFIPLLKGSINLTSEVYYDIRDFVKRIIRHANAAEVVSQ